ncbi:hypothetical protein M9H77_04296 [Catharanthus roseus]|uniref:Uncharacterized protein n=1 Tax=Catharanthus roseus TaxID=4058 RepID=A0ACC0CE90_CATRO|nr:hypothetical protein M9H77_04296 [Catharanthus roseus]
MMWCPRRPIGPHPPQPTLLLEWIYSHEFESSTPSEEALKKSPSSSSPHAYANAHRFESATHGPSSTRGPYLAIPFAMSKWISQGDHSESISMVSTNNTTKVASSKASSVDVNRLDMQEHQGVVPRAKAK